MEQHSFVSESHNSVRQQDDEGGATPHKCKASPRRGGPFRTCGVACQRRCRAIRQHARVRKQSLFLYRIALLWPLAPTLLCLRSATTYKVVACVETAEAHRQSAV